MPTNYGGPKYRGGKSRKALTKAQAARATKLTAKYKAAAGGPTAKPAASQARLKQVAKRMSAAKSMERKRAPASKFEGAMLTPYQKKMVAQARPKAKAQRSPQEIAAMQAFRARRPSKKRKAGSTTTRSLPYKSSTSGPYR